jgi:hypothetical protein
MKEAVSMIKKVALLSVLVIILLAATLWGLWRHFNRPLSDRQIIKRQFELDSPGYSSIGILQSSGNGTSLTDLRVLKLEVVIESYGEAVTCQGEIHYFRADPSYYELGWYDWACIEHWLLVEYAWEALQPSAGPLLCPAQVEGTALVLRRWVTNGWIDVNQIQRFEVRTQVIHLLDADVTATNKSGPFFDVSEVQVYDLVPELPEAEKLPTYVLRCDGTLELFLRGGPKWWEQRLALQVGDIVLPTPIEETIIQP